MEKILNSLMLTRKRWLFYVLWVEQVHSILILVLFSLWVVVVHLLHLLLISLYLKLLSFLLNLNLLLKMSWVNLKLFRKSVRLKDIFLMKVHRLLNLLLNKNKPLRVFRVWLVRDRRILILLLNLLHLLLVHLLVKRLVVTCLHTCNRLLTYRKERLNVREMCHSSS